MDLGNLSQNQIITTFGPGAIIDAKSDSVMGLDISYWNASGQEYKGRTIFFNKLASYLGVEFFKEPKQGRNSFPVTIFPDWHVCSNQKCNRLFKLSEEKTGEPGMYHDKGPTCPECNKKAYPSRFITMCDNGHIDEFPYREYLHNWKSGCKGKMRLYALSFTSSLNALTLKCDEDGCGATGKMGDALGSETFREQVCTGKHQHRPTVPAEKCDADVIPSLRGATNVYFSIVRSGLEIPPWSDPLYQVIEEKVMRFKQIVNDRAEEAKILESEFDVEKAKAIAYKLVFKEVSEQLPEQEIAFERFLEIFRKVSEGAKEYKEIKMTEYQSILNHETLATSNRSSFLASEEDVPGYLQDHFERIIRIEKVREITALKGFARGSYPDPENDDFNNIVNLDGEATGWLPAIRTSGEGIFIKLNEQKIEKWLSGFDSEKVSEIYANEYKNFIENKGWEHRSHKGLTYVLLHTLSHALIRELALNCGYSTTELKERIYYGDGMYGLLIYTGGGDTEGTLGGLEEMGKIENFKSIVVESLKTALVCSGDPSCMISYPGNGELNGAACHACTMIPETACENGNRLLDRRTLVPTEEKLMKGYFEGLVESLCGITI